MNVEHKIALAKSIGIIVLRVIIIISVFLLIASKNPSSINASVDLYDITFEIDCNFYEEDLRR